MKILYINACVRNSSRTNELAQYLLKKLNGDIDEINLNTERILPLFEKRLAYRDLLIANNDTDNEFFKHARQFANADIILISAPYWDFSFPAILKIYIENINVAGITFSYTPEGFPKSLCKAKSLIYITTAGGPIISDEYGFCYIKSLAKNFYGIEDINYIKAEGLDIANVNIQKILDNAKNDIDKLLFNLSSI